MWIISFLAGYVILHTWYFPSLKSTCNYVCFIPTHLPPNVSNWKREKVACSYHSLHAHTRPEKRIAGTHQHWTLLGSVLGGRPTPQYYNGKDNNSLCFLIIWISKNVSLSLYGHHLPQSVIKDALPHLALEDLISPEGSSLVFCELPFISPNHVCRRMPQPLYSGGCALVEHFLWWCYSWRFISLSSFWSSILVSGTHALYAKNHIWK